MHVLDQYLLNTVNLRGIAVQYHGTALLLLAILI